MFPSAPVILLTALTLAAPLAMASQLPIGLDGRERVHAQEYWQAGVPGYCVANRRGQAIQLRISRWRSGDRDASPLAVWDIPARATECRETPGWVGEWLLHFGLSDGTRLGLLKAPAGPRRVDAAGVASRSGLNGHCAMCGMWVEQDRLCQASGETIHLDLMTRANNGTITLPRLGVGEHPGLDALTLIRAGSDTLPVRVLDGVVEIDTTLASQTDQPRRIHLEYAARSVSTPALFTISAQVRGARRGRCCLTRGICVAPEN